MNDLEQAKKQVEAIDRAYLHSASNLDAYDVEFFVTLTRDLIAEVERLQVYHCDDEPSWRHRAEKLEREKAELEERHAALLKQNVQQEQEIEEFQSKLCGIKELYELHQSNRPDLPFAVRSKIVFRMEEIFQQVLSSTPECGHKGEVEKATKLIK